MSELVYLLERLSDLTTAAIISAHARMNESTSPQRTSGLQLIILYLATIRHGVDAARSLANRL